MNNSTLTISYEIILEEVLNIFVSNFPDKKDIISNSTEISVFSSENDFAYKFGLIILNLAEKYNLPIYEFETLNESDAFFTIEDVANYFYKYKK